MNKIIPIDLYNTDIMVHFGSQDTLKEELSLVYVSDLLSKKGDEE